MMGSEKDSEKLDQYFVFLGGNFFFLLFLLIQNFLEGWSVFCFDSYSIRNHKGLGVGRAGIPSVWISRHPVGVVDTHLMQHPQGRNRAVSWAGPWVAEGRQSHEKMQGNAPAALFYSESCANTQYKQIQVLQEEICTTHKAGTQKLNHSLLQRSCLTKILTLKASTDMVWKTLPMRGLYSTSLQCRRGMHKKRTRN